MAGKRHDAGVHAQLQMEDSQGNVEHQRGLCMHGKHSRQGTVHGGDMCSCRVLLLRSTWRQSPPLG